MTVAVLKYFTVLYFYIPLLPPKLSTTIPSSPISRNEI